jgi:hypothetical protein
MRFALPMEADEKVKMLAQAKLQISNMLSI